MSYAMYEHNYLFLFLATSILVHSHACLFFFSFCLPLLPFFLIFRTCFTAACIDAVQPPP